MAKIIYAVAGEGYGHSSRSQLIGKRLIDSGHDVIFAGSNKSLVYLREHFGERVKEVHGFLFDYKDGTVNPVRTVLSNIARYKKGFGINRRLYKECFSKFNPDLVITDFEPFSALWAIRHRVPFISIDHQHTLTHFKLTHPSGNNLSLFNAYWVIRLYYALAHSYISINFFNAPSKSSSAVMAPPVLRPEVEAIQPQQGDHIVIYSTHADGEQQLRDMLHSFKSHKFFVYGFNKYQEDGNIIFKERSTEGFLKDMATSHGVVASAGFSLISECMHMKKKMCLLPIPGQYEQIMNAHYVQELGLGLHCKQLNAETMAAFLAEVEKPIPTDERILWPSNEGFFEVLRERLKLLPNPIGL